jgi:hypothetical protein
VAGEAASGSCGDYLFEFDLRLAAPAFGRLAEHHDYSQHPVRAVLRE